MEKGQKDRGRRVEEGLQKGERRAEKRERDKYTETMRVNGDRKRGSRDKRRQEDER